MVVDQVRDGQAEPEEVENVLRACLDDAALRVLLVLPGRDEPTGFDGEVYDMGDDGESISLESRGTVIGALQNVYAAASSVLQGARVLWVKFAPPTLEQMFDQPLPSDAGVRGASSVSRGVESALTCFSRDADRVGRARVSRGLGSVDGARLRRFYGAGRGLGSVVAEQVGASDR